MRLQSSQMKMVMQFLSIKSGTSGLSDTDELSVLDGAKGCSI